MTKEDIIARHRELCAVLGDLESKHTHTKQLIVEEIITLNLNFDALNKADEAAKEPTAEEPKESNVS